MSKINNCHGCNALLNGVKSRISIPHTCGKSLKELADMMEEDKQFKRQIITEKWNHSKI